MISESLSSILLFGVLFGLSLIMFIIALTRQTIIPSVFSSVLWYSLSFAVWSFSVPTLGLTQASSITFFGLGFTMTVFTFYLAAEGLREAAEEKKRRIAEEVM